ncbi:MAG TPA: rod shape-determining protein RodA [Rectinemataceae bacterium]|nr:rod shape-determining protein RodA [Rectinemataceae bacterium]
MNRYRQLLEAMDYPTFGAVLLLVVIGIMSIFSSNVNAEGVIVSSDYLKQILWAVTGLILMLALVGVDFRQFKDFSIFLYGFLLIVLVYTRFFGKVVNGARSWIGIGEFGIQPSEFMKIAVILLLARYLDNSEHEDDIRRIAKSFGIVLLPVGLILLAPDLGTSLVFFPILFFMLVVSGIGRRFLIFILLIIGSMVVLTILPLWEKYILSRPTGFLLLLYQSPYDLIILGVVLVIMALSLWGQISFKKPIYYWIAYASLAMGLGLGLSILAHKVLKEYQVMRLIVFLDPSIDPRGSGWNIIQSITAIGSGGFTGRGFLAGPQSHNNYIPQQSTDFIFSIIAEEWGFLGGLLVFGLFWLILYRCTAIMGMMRDRYATYVVAGVMGMVFFHFMINSGMAMGIMPITGIPLLFLSYGGSSLLTIMAGMGIVLGISARRYHS